MFIEKMRAARDNPDSRHEPLLAEFMRRYDDAVTLTKPFPSVRDALSRLQAAGHHLGVCANKPFQPSRAVLRHLDLDTFFSAIIGGDSLATRKPDPAPLEAAFASLPDGGEIHVGSSDVDAQTARCAFVPFVLFSGGYRKSPVKELPHAALFNHFRELPDLVGTICRGNWRRLRAFSVRDTRRVSAARTSIVLDLRGCL